MKNKFYWNLIFNPLFIAALICSSLILNILFELIGGTVPLTTGLFIGMVSTLIAFYMVMNYPKRIEGE